MQAFLAAMMAGGPHGPAPTSAQATRDALQKQLLLMDEAKRTRLGPDFCDVRAGNCRPFAFPCIPLADPKHADAQCFSFFAPLRCARSPPQVVKWYKEHGLEAVPIHPKESTVEDLHTVASVFDLPEPDKTSLSIITPPQVSLPILKTSLLELGIKYIWLQPGAEDDALSE